MMKTKLALIAALCVAGFAQAAEWTWHGGGEAYGTASGNPSVSNWDGSSGTGVMTYAGVFSFVSGASVSQDTAILSLTNSSTSDGTSHTNNNGAKVFVTSDGNLKLQLSNTSGNSFTNSWSGTSTNINVFDGKDHVIGIAINNSGNTSNGINAGCAALIVDGQIVAEYEGGNGAYHFWKTTLDSLSYGAEGVTDEVWLAAANGIVSADEVTAAGVLPEPTALALLALGVAGVALRRRVA